MNPDTPLELRDIHLPDPVSWWPPALGWWVVMGGIVLLVMAWVLVHRWSKRHRLKKVALAELDKLLQAFIRDQDTQRFTGEISALLRRVCLTRYPRHQVAGLTGEAWLAFLDQGLSSPFFSQGEGRVLISAPFQRQMAVNGEELVRGCQQWLQVHLLRARRQTQNAKGFFPRSLYLF